MPLYEFRCESCGKEFSELCRIAWEGTVACPACGSVRLRRRMSQVSGMGRTGGEGGGCGGCTGKSCGNCH